MLAIILGILKFIGLLILGILGTALFLLLLVLLVPVRYRVQGTYYGAPKGAAGVSWLLHILTFQVRYDGEADMCVRVFGIRLGRRKAAAEEPDGGKLQRPGEGAQDGGMRRSAEADRDTEEKRDPGEVSDAGGDPGLREEPDAGEESDPGQVLPPPAKGQRQKRKRKFSFVNPVQKIRVTFQKICGKLKALGEKKDQVLDFLNQEDNKATLRLLKRQVLALFKHILPGRVKGRLKFGFDDPYTTGQVLTWVSPFYGLYAKNLQLIPVFGEKVLEGELELKGRVRIGTVIAIALRMLFDKNFRKLLKRWREA